MDVFTIFSVFSVICHATLMLSLQLGIHEDSSNRKKLAGFLRYRSSQSADDMIKLKDYVSRMKDGQKDIYYVSGKFLYIL